GVRENCTAVFPAIDGGEFGARRGRFVFLCSVQEEPRIPRSGRVSAPPRFIGDRLALALDLLTMYGELGGRCAELCEQRIEAERDAADESRDNGCGRGSHGTRLRRTSVSMWNVCGKRSKRC